MPYTAFNRRDRSLMTLPGWGRKVLLLAIKGGGGCYWGAALLRMRGGRCYWGAVIEGWHCSGGLFIDGLHCSEGAVIKGLHCSGGGGGGGGGCSSKSLCYIIFWHKRSFKCHCNTIKKGGCYWRVALLRGAVIDGFHCSEKAVIEVLHCAGGWGRLLLTGSIAQGVAVIEGLYCSREEAVIEGWHCSGRGEGGGRYWRVALLRGRLLLRGCIAQGGGCNWGMALLVVSKWVKCLFYFTFRPV